MTYQYCYECYEGKEVGDAQSCAVCNTPYEINLRLFFNYKKHTRYQVEKFNSGNSEEWSFITATNNRWSRYSSSPRFYQMQSYIISMQIVGTPADFKKQIGYLEQLNHVKLVGLYNTKLHSDSDNHELKTEQKYAIAYDYTPSTGDGYDYFINVIYSSGYDDLANDEFIAWLKEMPTKNKEDGSHYYIDFRGNTLDKFIQFEENRYFAALMIGGRPWIDDPLVINNLSYLKKYKPKRLVLRRVDIQIENETFHTDELDIQDTTPDQIRAILKVFTADKITSDWGTGTKSQVLKWVDGAAERATTYRKIHDELQDLLRVFTQWAYMQTPVMPATSLEYLSPTSVVQFGIGNFDYVKNNMSANYFYDRANSLRGQSLVFLKMSNHGGDAGTLHRIMELLPLLPYSKPIVDIDLDGTVISESTSVLSPLSGTSIRNMNLNNASVGDLRFLNGCSITNLIMSGVRLFGIETENQNISAASLDLRRCSVADTVTLLNLINAETIYTDFASGTKGDVLAFFEEGKKKAKPYRTLETSIKAAFKTYAGIEPITKHKPEYATIMVIDENEHVNLGFSVAEDGADRLLDHMKYQSYALGISLSGINHSTTKLRTLLRELEEVDTPGMKLVLDLSASEVVSLPEKDTLKWDIDVLDLSYSSINSSILDQLINFNLEEIFLNDVEFSDTKTVQVSMLKNRSPTVRINRVSAVWNDLNTVARIILKLKAVNFYTDFSYQTEAQLLYSIDEHIRNLDVIDKIHHGDTVIELYRNQNLALKVLQKNRVVYSYKIINRNIEELDVKVNTWTQFTGDDIVRWINEFPQLKHLSAYNLGGTLRHRFKLPNLITLSILNGSMGDANAKTFSQIPRLEELVIVNCGLSSLPEGSLDPLKNLKKLDLHQNSLQSLPSMKTSSLTELILNNNNLTSLAPLNIDSLKEVFMDRAFGLIKIFPDSITQLGQNVEVLVLSNNDLQAKDNLNFDTSYPKLTTLILDHNKFTRVPISNVNFDMELLDISYNNINGNITPLANIDHQDYTGNEVSAINTPGLNMNSIAPTRLTNPAYYNWEKNYYLNGLGVHVYLRNNNTGGNMFSTGWLHENLDLNVFSMDKTRSDRENAFRNKIKERYDEQEIWRDIQPILLYLLTNVHGNSLNTKELNLMYDYVFEFHKRMNVGEVAKINDSWYWFTTDWKYMFQKFKP